MKFLIYSLNDAPEPISTDKYTGEMAAWLAARGHDVEAIVGLTHYPQWKLDERYAVGRIRNEWLEGVQVRRAFHSILGSQSVNAHSRILMEASFTFAAVRYRLPKLFLLHRADVVIAVMLPLQIGGLLLYVWVRRVLWVLHVQDLRVDAALPPVHCNALERAGVMYSWKFTTANTHVG
jgi:colanic acid biosynthesis glycosyl transferase WcaI